MTEHPLDDDVRILQDHIADARAGFEAEERVAAGAGDQQRVLRLRSARAWVIGLLEDELRAKEAARVRIDE